MTPTRALHHRPPLGRTLAGLVVAAAILFGAAGTSRADIELSPNLSIGGFIVYHYDFMDDLAKGTSPTKERSFDLGGEIDFKIKWSWATARFDLNLPSDGNEEPHVAPTDPNSFGLEQARFDIMPKFGQAYNLNMTGGIFNAPYGREAQDPTDGYTIDHSLQFALTPSNLLGISAQFGKDYFSLGGIVANEWQQDTDKQLSYGVYGTLSPSDKFNLFLGGLFSTQAIGDNYVVNSVAHLNFTAKNSLAIEGTLNQKNYAIGGTFDHDCQKGGDKEAFPGGFAVRYDYLRARAGSEFAFGFSTNVPSFTYSPTQATEFHQATLSGFIAPFDHLKVQGEGTATRVNVDGPGDDNTWYSIKAQLLYTF
ncbi:MAG: outer membrane beta-barrel protein [Nitrospirae bacterium]|nr:outer membrane beta-barrel protein [Nitrospirota bacterium]